MNKHEQIIKIFVVLLTCVFVKCLQDGEENCETLPSEIHLIKGNLSLNIDFSFIMFYFNLYRRV